MLAQIVELYFNMTSDLSFVDEILPALCLEYDFLMQHYSVPIAGGTMNLYRSPSKRPRPEAYHEAMAMADHQPPGTDPILQNTMYKLIGKLHTREGRGGEGEEWEGSPFYQIARFLFL